MLKVGFIGLGIMGQPMAQNVLNAGFPLTVFNRTRTRRELLLGVGASGADSPKEVASSSDVVITMVSDTPEAESVLFGAEGVWFGLRRGMTVIDMSTISPTATMEFARRVAEKGCEMLDAPVSGGEPGARQGTLTIMVGGTEEVFQSCLPLFQAMGKTITYTGPSGSGQKTKLVNQVMVALNLLAMVEGLRLAAAGGLNPETTLRVISGGAAGSWMMTNLAPKILAADFAPGFRIQLQQKDLRLAAEWIHQLGIDCPGTELTYSLFTEALNKGLGAQSTHGLIHLWAEGQASP